MSTSGSSSNQDRCPEKCGVARRRVGGNQIACVSDEYPMHRAIAVDTLDKEAHQVLDREPEAARCPIERAEFDRAKHGDGDDARRAAIRAAVVHDGSPVPRSSGILRDQILYALDGGSMLVARESFKLL